MKGMWVPPGGQIVAHQRLCSSRSCSPRAGSCLPGLYLLGGRTSQGPWRLAGAEGCWDTGCGRQGLPLSCWVNSVESWPFAWPPEAPTSLPCPPPPTPPPPQLQFQLPTFLDRFPISAPSEGVS